MFDLGKHLKDAALATVPASEISTVENTQELKWLGRHPKDDSVITEVVWVGNSSLIVKEVNRNANDGNVVLFDLNNSTWSQGKVVRKLGKEGEEGDRGWIDNVSF